jgi:hypothetical protein
MGMISHASRNFMGSDFGPEVTPHDGSVPLVGQILGVTGPRTSFPNPHFAAMATLYNFAGTLHTTSVLRTLCAIFVYDRRFGSCRCRLLV